MRPRFAQETDDDEGGLFRPHVSVRSRQLGLFLFFVVQYDIASYLY